MRVSSRNASARQHWSADPRHHHCQPVSRIGPRHNVGTVQLLGHEQMNWLIETGIYTKHILEFGDVRPSRSK